jgi:membrane dipeptidase
MQTTRSDANGTLAGGRTPSSPGAHPRSSLLAVFAAACLLALGCDSGVREPVPPPDLRAHELHRSAIVIDGHNDVTTWILESGFDLGMDGADPRKKSVEPWLLLMRFLAPPPGAELRTHTDLQRLERGGVDAQFFSIWADPRGRGPGEYRTRAIEMIEALLGQFVRHAGRLTLAVSARDIREAAAAGKIAGLLGLEGGHAIEDDLENVENFYDLGVRYMTLTHTKTLDWADSATDEARHSGLTRFGEEVVREMNRLGMLVDLSHVSPATMQDALRVSEAPVIFSHSSARALCDHPRNVPDEILAALKANGGVVMVTFVNAFISGEFARASAPLWKEYDERSKDLPDPAARERLRRELQARMPKIKVTIADVADHVEHVRKVAGIEHVGLGGDFDGNDAWPEGLGDVSGYPRLFAELVRRGWSDEELARLASGNLLRVMRQAEAVARRLQQTRPASTATIEGLDGIPQ